MTLTSWLTIVFGTLTAAYGNRIVEETDDIDNFKAVMQQIFIEELGEDLRRKLESISNEGVRLKRTNEEINAMVQSRLNAEEKKRMKKAFEAIAGPAKKLASKRLKGQKITRSSQFQAKNAQGPSKTQRANEEVDNTASNADRKDKIEL